MFTKVILLTVFWAYGQNGNYIHQSQYTTMEQCQRMASIMENQARQVTTGNYVSKVSATCSAVEIPVK